MTPPTDLTEILDELDLAASLQVMGRLVDDAVAQAMTARGYGDLTWTHWFVVNRLIDEPATAADIAEALQVPLRSVAVQLAALDRLGYVERAADPDDPRVTLARLTRRGRSALRAVRTVRAALAKSMVAELGEEHEQALRRAVSATIDVLDGVEQVQDRTLRPPGLKLA